MRLIFIILSIFLFYCNSWAAVKASHPRLYLTDARMATMQGQAQSNSSQWQRLMAFADGDFYSLDNQHIMNRALVYKIKQANGDNDANTYRDAAITRAMSVIEWGVSTGIDGYKLTDSTKNWIDEGSQWASETLIIKRYYGINPDVSQNKFFRMNTSYGEDESKPSHTDTEFYIHPSPSTTLLETMFSPRSEFAASATPGSTYVIFPSDSDFTKDRVMGVALVFDWLYDDLTTQQKNIMVAWMYGAAKYMMTDANYGMQTYSWGNYPVNYLADLTAVAYAIYGHDTTKANEILAYVESKYQAGVKESMKWTLENGGWLEGDGYGASVLHRFTEFLDHSYTAEGLDRFSDFSEELKGRLLYSMHMTLPKLKEGTGGVMYREVIANGDGAKAWEAAYDYMRKSALMIISHYPNETISKAAQTFFSDTANRNIYPFQSGWEFLFYNPNQATLPVTSAPLQNAAINTGMVQMRSDWGSNATQATFKCGPKLSYHSHLDATAFTIFKHEDLAPDTGTYPGSGGTEHGSNYFIRTIAHNALLLYDPTESSWTGSVQGSSGDYSNDGGQRNVRTWNTNGSLKNSGSWQTTGYNTGGYKYIGSEDIYKMGSITKYASGADFVYSVGDATSGYDGNTHKAQQVIRKFLYLRPDFFVVYDKVKTKDTSIVPKFVLHSVDTMAVNGTPTTVSTNAEYHYTNGNTLTIDNGAGRLFSKTLIPASPVIKKIGGRDLRDFWVDGTNYSPGSDHYGLWRAEIEAPVQSTYTEFLTVLQATSTSTSSMVPATAITSTSGQMRGVVIESGGINDYIAMFSNDEEDDPAGSTISYSISGYTSPISVVTDLVPDTNYYVTATSASVTISTTPGGELNTSSSDGVISFSADGTAFAVSGGGGEGMPPSSTLTNTPLTRKAGNTAATRKAGNTAVTIQ